MSQALPGEHYCAKHQGNFSHYAKHNCTVCTQAAEIERLTKLLALQQSSYERELALERQPEAQPAYVPLTDEDITKACDGIYLLSGTSIVWYDRAIARAVEAEVLRRLGAKP